jgi:hypothetical protein
MIIFGLVVLETEIYVQVIIRTEHVEIFGIKRFYFIREIGFCYICPQIAVTIIYPSVSGIYN